MDNTGEHYSQQNLRDELEDESIDLGRDTRAALSAHGQLVAFTRVQAPADVGDADRI